MTVAGQARAMPTATARPIRTAADARLTGSDRAAASRPFPLRRDGRPGAGLSAARRSRRAPTSPSSAAATPACRRRCISPRPASTSCCSRPSGSAGARRGGTAASFIPASGATRTGWRSISAATTRASSGTLAEEAKALVKDLIARHAIDCDWRDGLIETVHKRRLVAGEIAYVDKLKRDYGYAPVEWLDRDGARRGDRHRRLFRRAARHGRRPSRPAEVRAGAGAGRGEGRGAHLRGDAGDRRHRYGAADARLATGARRRSPPTSSSSPATAISTASTTRPRRGSCRSTTTSSPPRRSAPGRPGGIIPGGEAVSDTRFVVYYFRPIAGRPADLRRRRDLFAAGRRPTSPPSSAGISLRIYPQLADIAHRPRLGRDAGDHAAPPALHPAGAAGRLCGGGLFRARAWRWRRSPARCSPTRSAAIPARLDRFAALPVPALPRRQAPALPGAGRRDELVRAPRPALADRRDRAASCSRCTD